MAIKIVYDAQADRMRLTLTPEVQESQLFWLNRNQCLGLLARIEAASKAMDITLKDIKPLRTVPMRPRKEVGPHDPIPESLTEIRLRKDGERLKVLFLQSKAKGLGISLIPEAVVKVHQLLAVEATKAGWDPIAGLNRLKAVAQARQAQKKQTYQS